MKHNALFRSQLDRISPTVKQEMDWSCAIVDKVESILKDKGITRRELAHRVGCSESQISRWTRGFPNYTISALAKLSAALDEPLISING